MDSGWIPKLGLTDFFYYLLPGLIILMAGIFAGDIWNYLGYLGLWSNSPEPDKWGVLGWVCLLILGYLLGHVVQALGKVIETAMLGKKTSLVELKKKWGKDVTDALEKKAQSIFGFVPERDADFYDLVYARVVTQDRTSNGLSFLRMYGFHRSLAAVSLLILVASLAWNIIGIFDGHIPTVWEWTIPSLFLFWIFRSRAKHFGSLFVKNIFIEFIAL